MIDKKRLKEEYKRMIPPMGVFMIKNKNSGLVFLGSSLNLKSVLDKHKMLLSAKMHMNSRLQRDWNESGAEAFEFAIAETLEPKDDPDYNYSEDLSILEMLWIDKYRPIDEKLYNKSEKIRGV
ncbi:MAG: GIY-YIG nuclease family protein [Chloroflexota bacterium]